MHPGSFSSWEPPKKEPTTMDPSREKEISDILERYKVTKTEDGYQVGAGLEREGAALHLINLSREIRDFGVISTDILRDNKNRLYVDNVHGRFYIEFGQVQKP